MSLDYGKRAMSLVEQMRVADDIEVGTFGKWAVTKFKVGENDMMRQLGTAYRTGRYTPPGGYAVLHRDRTLVMSDTPDELNDLWTPMHMAMRDDTRSVLIHGLGLGCFVKGLVSLDHIESIEIVEIDDELIDGMPKLAPWLNDPRVTIYHDDAYTRQWPVGQKWDVVWHDIWDDLGTDNLATGYARLNRRFGNRARWQGAWGQWFLQSMRARGY